MVHYIADGGVLKSLKYCKCCRALFGDGVLKSRIIGVVVVHCIEGVFSSQTYVIIIVHCIVVFSSQHKLLFKCTV